jgi:hypothetical protein
MYLLFFGELKRLLSGFKDANIQPVSYASGTNEDGTVKIDWEILESSIEFKNDPSANIDGIPDDFGCVTAGFRGIYVSLRGHYSSFSHWKYFSTRRRSKNTSRARTWDRWRYWS